MNDNRLGHSVLSTVSPAARQTEDDGSLTCTSPRSSIENKTRLSDRLASKVLLIIELN